MNLPSPQKNPMALTASTTERSLAAIVRSAEQVTLCDDNHHALKSREAAWQAALFGGYQPLGSQLGELRCCPICESSVVRLVSFRAALFDLLDHLLAPHRPDEVYVHSASMLVEWAQSNLPGQLGIAADRPAPAELTSPAGQGDVPQLGQELRKRRERAGLTRSQLSRLAGVAGSTIRNYERGRHRPTHRTMWRISSVPALRLGSAGSEPVDAPSQLSAGANVGRV